MMNQVSDFFGKFSKSCISIAKILLESKSATIAKGESKRDGKIIILGNGPSLNTTIADHLDALKQTDTMAVNFFANSPVFSVIKPKYYILVDPLFFDDNVTAENFTNLRGNIASVDWQMTLIVPAKYKVKICPEIRTNKFINVLTINAVGVEGWRWLVDIAYKKGWGMPRPRNVLIPAIMSAIQMGYREVYVVGADHSWMSTISVNERNEVVSIQPHFYKEDEKEEKRIKTDYLRYPLHEIVHSFYVAFKSYHDIRAFADRHGVKVYNSTPVSFIDAFERKGL